MHIDWGKNFALLQPFLRIFFGSYLGVVQEGKVCNATGRVEPQARLTTPICLYLARKCR